MEQTSFTEPQTDAPRAAEFAARAAYGRLLAYLALQWRDVAAAEDALSEAFLQALTAWPAQGVPERPEAWLLTVARRKLIDARRRLLPIDSVDVDTLHLEVASGADASAIPDKRLALMLLSAHPSIDANVRVALMLQTVLGVEVRIMAPAFLVSPEALMKRLTRAKRKIRDAGISFELPGRDVLQGRMHDVLEAIYAAYFLGTDASQTDGDAPDTLSQEALYLADIVVALEPENAEALGLLSLLAFCEARRPAQTSEEGMFVPLGEQDMNRWSMNLIDAGHQLLARAHHQKQPGAFQTEAAIQAAHCSRLNSGTTPWSEIARLYDVLIIQSPTRAVQIGRATAKTFAENDGNVGLAILDAQDPTNATYMPWWLARAHFLFMTGEKRLAADALRRAIGLSTQPRMRNGLLKRLTEWTERS